MTFEEIPHLILSYTLKKSRWIQFSYLDLRFCHAESIGQLGSLGSCQVLCLLESFLQGKNLLTRKGWPRVFLLSILIKVSWQV